MSSQTAPSIVSRIAHATRAAVSHRAADESWWSALEPGFHKRPESFDLRLRDRVLVGASAASDVVVRTLGATVVGALAVPLGYHPMELRRAIADRRIYNTAAAAGDPAIFFPRPPMGVQMKVRRVRFPCFRPGDGSCYDLSFESPFEPFNPRVRARYLSHRANQTAHARYWRHEGGPRPTIIAVHGFGAEQHWLNVWFQALRWMYGTGSNVLHFTLPFHGPRQIRLSPFSGYGFFSGGICRINEAFGQAVHDARVFMDYLMGTECSPQVGVTGVSLGGFTSALLASSDSRLSFSVPIVPVTSLADLVMEWHPISFGVRSLLKAIGATVSDARQALAVSSPLTYAPLLPKEHLMVVGGVGDRLAPPKHSRLLWDHWERCRIHWFPGSHLLHMDKGDYLREIGRFMRDVGFLTP